MNQGKPGQGDKKVNLTEHESIKIIDDLERDLTGKREI